VKRVLRRRCIVCGGNYDLAYTNQKDYLEAARGLPNPFYCTRHNPKLLHDQELLEACKELLGILYFDLTCFRRYSFPSEDVRIIDHLKYSEEHIVNYDGTCETHIDLIMVWSKNTTKKDLRDSWTSRSGYSGLHETTPEDIEEIKEICARKLKGDMGLARIEFTAGYMAILERIKTIDFKIL
jgi:hypothetical protein